jgi:hypothetical protein
LNRGRATDTMDTMTLDTINCLLGHIADTGTYVVCRAACSLFSRLLDSPAYKEMRERLVDNYAFTRSCDRGHLEAAQWLFTTLGAEWAKASYGAKHALCLACLGGHLPVAKWLTKMFSLTATDARTRCNYPLRRSCENGHLSVAQWLVDAFGLTGEDAHASDNYAFREACKNGQFEVVCWLTETFKLEDYDTRTRDNIALKAACTNGHHELALWLVETFGLNKEDMRYVDLNQLREAAKDNENMAAQWLLHYAGERQPWQTGGVAADTKKEQPRRKILRGGHQPGEMEHFAFNSGGRLPDLEINVTYLDEEIDALHKKL